MRQNASATFPNAATAAPEATAIFAEAATASSEARTLWQRSQTMQLLLLRLHAPAMLPVLELTAVPEATQDVPATFPNPAFWGHNATAMRPDYANAASEPTKRSCNAPCLGIDCCF